MEKTFTAIKLIDRKPLIEQVVIGIGYTGEVSRMTMQENGYWQSLEHESECDEPEFWLEDNSIKAIKPIKEKVKCDHEFIPTNSKWQSQGQNQCINCGEIRD